MVNQLAFVFFLSNTASCLKLRRLRQQVQVDGYQQQQQQFQVSEDQLNQIQGLPQDQPQNFLEDQWQKMHQVQPQESIGRPVSALDLVDGLVLSKPAKNGDNHTFPHVGDQQQQFQVSEDQLNQIQGLPQDQHEQLQNFWKDQWQKMHQVQPQESIGRPDSALDLGDGLVLSKPAKKGDNHTFPHVGDHLFVAYTGYLQDNSTFDSGVFQFAIGGGQAIQGWDKALMHMSLGERAVLRVPAALAYGDDGKPGLIPPKASLVFDLSLLQINLDKAVA